MQQQKLYSVVAPKKKERVSILVESASKQEASVDK